MTALIYRPTKSATQSGMRRTKKWLLIHEIDHPRAIEPLMGWTSSNDTRDQVSLAFDTKEEAIDYANRHGLTFEIAETEEPVRRSVSYSDNFRVGRMQPWTH